MDRSKNDIQARNCVKQDMATGYSKMGKKHRSTVKTVRQSILYVCFAMLFSVVLLGCDSIDAVMGDNKQPPAQTVSSGNTAQPAPSNSSSSGSNSPGSNQSEQQPAGSSWDNSIKVLTPEIPGTEMLATDVDAVDIDISNKDKGYVVVHYVGDSAKVKLIITKVGGDIDYKYDLTKDAYEVFPLSEGSGEYEIGVYEIIQGTQYTQIFKDTFSAEIADEFLPALYPNQYVNFSADSQAVKIAQEVTANATDDFNAVEHIYNYAVNNIEYDRDKAELAQQGQLSGYLPNVDQTLVDAKGICFDYAAVVSAMLRSQGIPSKLVIGYADDRYHAWIRVHIDGVGWVDAIEFSGEDWVLMDPTLASTGGSFGEFVGQGDIYNELQYF
ncbi:transglutaminase-like domain-containing protein [Christensenellaceae bacterium OttesenSCG-928-K19]|nr:transglutaminase-like domain-containing protein [Christensenellaceae bacterium OttesenSCG-928-K19]